MRNSNKYKRNSLLKKSDPKSFERQTSHFLDTTTAYNFSSTRDVSKIYPLRGNRVAISYKRSSIEDSGDEDEERWQRRRGSGCCSRGCGVF